MSVVFQKMHGAGNDFVLLDLREQHLEVDARVARELAHRHTGVGCDQVLVLRPPAAPGRVLDFEVWNADGSRAEQCGNGVRCIGHYLDMRAEAPAGMFRIGGPVAELELECLGEGQVRVNMGVPDFGPDEIPLAAPARRDWYELPTQDGTIRVGAVSMGNPHALVQVTDVETAPVAAVGPAISRHHWFSDGCNVGFAEVVDRGNIRLRVYERGSGETLACGSGACAAVAILAEAGFLSQQVLVNQVGGDLIIVWPGNHHPITMTGPASHVFEGILK